MGVILEAIPSGDNIIRSCRVKVKNSELIRPVRRLHRLELSGTSPAVPTPQDLTDQNPLPERVADYLVSKKVDLSDPVRTKSGRLIKPVVKLNL